MFLSPYPCLPFLPGDDFMIIFKFFTLLDDCEAMNTGLGVDVCILRVHVSELKGTIWENF